MVHQILQVVLLITLRKLRLLEKEKGRGLGNAALTGSKRTIRDMPWGLPLTTHPVVCWILYQVLM